MKTSVRRNEFTYLRRGLAVAAFLAALPLAISLKTSLAAAPEPKVSANPDPQCTEILPGGKTRPCDVWSVAQPPRRLVAH
jgi:hypothetical protein